MHKTNDRSHYDERPWLIFLVLLAAYLLAYSGQFHSADEISMLSTAESLAKVGWFDTPQRIFEVQVGLPIPQSFEGIDGHIYSKYGWGWPVFLAPFYAVSLLSPELGGLQVAHLATLVVTALTGTLVYYCGRELGFNSRVSLLGSFTFGLGTIAFVYSKFLFAEPFVGLALTGSVGVVLRCRHRRLSSWQLPALGGLLFGLAAAARIATLILGPIFAAFLICSLLAQERTSSNPRPVGRRIWHSVIAFCIGVSIPILLSGLYNWITVGNPWQTAYESEMRFTTPLWEGLYGLLLSPGKGFFWFSPVLLLALPGSRMLWKRSKLEVLFVWGLFAGMACLYATWYMWWGGSAWGPRFLVPLAAPLTLLVLPVLEQAGQHRSWSPLIGALCCVSIAAQVLGSAVNFLDYGASLVALDPRAEWTLAIYSLKYQPLWGHLQLLQPEHLDLSWIQHVGTRFVVDWKTLCAYGGAAIACATAILWRQKRRGGRWLPLVLTMLCIGVMGFGQLRLHDARAASPGGRQWQLLYEQIATSAEPGDVIFVQDATGAAVGFEFDRSRTRRYRWSPRPAPLDQRSEELIAQSAASRVWLVSGQPAVVDPNRGIERWLLEHGAKLSEKQFNEGARLILIERTPADLVEHTASLTFDDQVRLLEYAHPEHAIAQGQAIHLVLTWQAVRHPDFDYSVFVHLLDASGQIVQQTDGSPVGGLHPIGAWQEGELVIDRYGFLLAEDLPEGTYRLVAGVYRWDTLERLSIVSKGGNPAGDLVDLGEVRVSAAQAASITP